MSVYGKINVSDFTLVDSKFHKTKLLTSGTVGISRVQTLSSSYDSINPNNSYNTPTTQSSHWHSSRVLFYSQSFNKHYGIDKGISLVPRSPKMNILTHKFHSTASVFYIPQKYFGEEIQKKSFTLTDNSHPSGTVTIKDDGQGNLYALGNTVSKSASTSISSSDNYVGNIFYDSGIINVNETSSFNHTPSTATIIVGGGDIPLVKDNVTNHFFMTGSNLTTSIKFLCLSSGTGTDTTTLKHFASGSTTTITANNAVNKINSVFGGTFVTASNSSNTITITNSANKLLNRRPNNDNDNLPPISGSKGFVTASGFANGAAAVPYTGVGSGNYTVKFNSTQTYYTRQWTVKIKPDTFMQTMNTTARALISGSATNMGTIHMYSPFMKPMLTGSKWAPYVNQIALYNDTEIHKVFDDDGQIKLKQSEPLVIANLPRPIKMRDDLTVIFKIKLDY